MKGGGGGTIFFVLFFKYFLTFIFQGAGWGGVIGGVKLRGIFLKKYYYIKFL